MRGSSRGKGAHMSSEKLVFEEGSKARGLVCLLMTLKASPTILRNERARSEHGWNVSASQLSVGSNFIVGAVLRSAAQGHCDLICLLPSSIKLATRSFDTKAGPVRAQPCSSPLRHSSRTSRPYLLTPLPRPVSH